MCRLGDFLAFFMYYGSERQQILKVRHNWIPMYVINLLKLIKNLFSTNHWIVLWVNVGKSKLLFSIKKNLVVIAIWLQVTISIWTFNFENTNYFVLQFWSRYSVLCRSSLYLI